MKNIKDRINEKLFKQEEKVELSEVVELNMAKMFDRIEKKVLKFVGESFKNQKKAISLSKELGSILSDYDSTVKNIKELEQMNELQWKEFKAKAKDLGVKPEGTFGERAYNSINSEIDKLNKNLRDEVQRNIK